MRRKRNFLMLGILLIVLFVGGVSLWSRNRTKSIGQLIGSLTVGQRECIEQEIGRNDLNYVEKEVNTDFVYIGYQAQDNYYVSIMGTGVYGDCVVEFREKIWNCYEERVDTACIEGYEFRLGDIQKVELTGDPLTEIYVSFDTQGSGKRNNAHHVFFTVKPDGEYEALLHLQLCLGFSSVEIDYVSQTVNATDDLVCDTFHGRKEHIEYSLQNGELTVLADWFDE